MEVIKDNLNNHWKTFIFGLFLIAFTLYLLAFIVDFKKIVVVGMLILGVILVIGSSLKPKKSKNDFVSEKKDNQRTLPDNSNVVQFYLNIQKCIRYHGERMWDSMKIFGIIFPLITGVITIVTNYMLAQDSTLPFGKEFSALFLIPITFTAIFWFNSYREYLRFLEYSLMSWGAEKKLNLHESLPVLENKPLVIPRFLEKPPLKPKFGDSFWTTICLFFGSSLIIEIVLMCYIYSIIPT